MTQTSQLSLRDALQKETQIPREALSEILEHPNRYAYMSGGSHPDTNAAYSHILTAQRALKRADDVAHQAAGGTE